METATVINLTGTFLTGVGDVVAELKRQDIAKLDLELLSLKRKHLAESLRDFESQLQSAVAQEKADTESDLLSRGLANTTVRQSVLRGIENDASTEVDRASREYNRAIEEIALLERKVIEQARPIWRKLLSCFTGNRTSATQD